MLKCTNIAGMVAICATGLIGITAGDAFSQGIRGHSLTVSYTVNFNVCNRTACKKSREVSTINFYVGASGDIYHYGSKGQGRIVKPGRNFTSEGVSITVTTSGNTLTSKRVYKEGHTLITKIIKTGNTCKVRFGGDRKSVV